MVCPEGTALLLLPKLKEILARINLTLENAYATTDAGQPMPALFADMLDRWFRCFAHLQVSQNAVEAALKKNEHFKRLVSLVDTNVGQITASNKRLAVFDSTKKALEAASDGEYYIQ